MEEKREHDECTEETDQAQEITEVETASGKMRLRKATDEEIAAATGTTTEDVEQTRRVKAAATDARRQGLHAEIITGSDGKKRVMILQKGNAAKLKRARKSKQKRKMKLRMKKRKPPRKLTPEERAERRKKSEEKQREAVARRSSPETDAELKRLLLQ